MMVNRFGVLRSPLRVSILNIGPLIQSIARLHNFLLNENNDYDWETNSKPAQPIHGISIIREALVKRVREAGLTRP
jgi:hypothetical protein